MELRPYQIDAAAAIERELETLRATLLVLATGLGKTVVFCEVSRRFIRRGARVLVLVHRDELGVQAADKFRPLGLSVGTEQADQRVDCASLPDVVIASVQSLRGKRLKRFGADAFGLIVVDETHHIVAPSYRAVIDHFHGARVLGVTATPDRGDGVALGNVFATCAFRMDIGDGIKSGFLAPLEFRSVRVKGLDLSKVRTSHGDFRADDLEAEMLRDKLLHELAAPIAELIGVRPTIVFVPTVAVCHALASVLSGYGLTAAAIDGSMNKDQRAHILGDYKAGRTRVLVNCALLTEGFDAPATACIVLARPTKSRALVAQMVGRGTRLAEGKTTCLILDMLGSGSRIRLASPADVLAGEPLPEPMADRIAEICGTESVDLEAAIGQARREAAAADAEKARQEARKNAETRRLVERVGVVFAAPFLDVRTLLECAPEPSALSTPAPGVRASDSQLTALRNSGFKDLPDDLTRVEAHKLFELMAARRRSGLCTIRQARQLRRRGFRDDLSPQDAGIVLSLVEYCGWNTAKALDHHPRLVEYLAQFCEQREQGAA